MALTDTTVYVFSSSGTYLGTTAHTSAQGEVSFALASGWYRFTVDHMGYQFWCDALEVPDTLSYTMTIPHRDNTITVNTFYTGGMVPLEGVKVYLFTEAGSYQNQYQQTNAQGQVTFAVPDQSYKVRVDYLGGQYWSEAFQWQDREVVIDEGMVDLHVTWNGAEVSGAPVYLFTETGAYLSRSNSTDPQGHAQFQVPVKAYKFRIDYNGQQYWTSVITPIAHQSLPVDVPLEQLALMPTNNPNPTRHDGEPPVFKHDPIRVASLGSLVGILSQTVVAQVAQPKVYFYITDHLGTPQKVVDAAGAIVWSGDYRPFGEVSSGVSTVQNAFRFPGQYYDSETGLHYNCHRYYQPRTGRYLTPDPLGLQAGHNCFSYTDDNPLRRIDPRGLSDCPLEKQKFFTWLYRELIQMAAELRVPVNLLLKLAAKEGGWADQHLAHNMPLNNPFGVNYIERGEAVGNKRYTSLTEATGDWKRLFGNRVRGAQTEQEFIDRLQCKKDACRPYNTKTKTWETDFKNIKMDKWLKACECHIKQLMSAE